MKYEINKKNLKQSATNLSQFFKDNGYAIPRNLILDSMAKIFFFKNWNTLEAVSTHPEQIVHINNQKSYIFEIEIEKCTRENLLKLFELSFKESKAEFLVTQFLSNGNKHYIELDMSESSNNVITAILSLGDKLKPHYKVNRLDMCRVTVEKENLLPLVSNEALEIYRSKQMVKVVKKT